MINILLLEIYEDFNKEFYPFFIEFLSYVFGLLYAGTHHTI